MKDDKKCVKKAQVGFITGENYHVAMKIVRHVRKALKVKIVFNILGPLLNPARVQFAVIGVYDEAIVSFLQISYYRILLITKMLSVWCS
jgi:anthranilate phosphoribosyltransferase